MGKGSPSLGTTPLPQQPLPALGARPVYSPPWRPQHPREVVEWETWLKAKWRKDGKAAGERRELRGLSPLLRVRVPEVTRGTRAASFWVVKVPHPTPTPT